MSPAVRQALARDPLQGLFCARFVTDAKPCAVAVPEIKLGEIAVQMLFAAMLVHAFHAAFEIE
jgi:hypothetical protein